LNDIRHGHAPWILDVMDDTGATQCTLTEFELALLKLEEPYVGWLNSSRFRVADGNVHTYKQAIIQMAFIRYPCDPMIVGLQTEWKDIIAVFRPHNGKTLSLLSGMGPRLFYHTATRHDQKFDMMIAEDLAGLQTIVKTNQP